MTPIPEGPRNERNDGFTLIETALALTVLLAGILAGAHLFGYAVATAHRAELRAHAAFLVALKAGEIRANPTAPAPGGSLDPRNPAAAFHEYLAAAPGGLWKTVRSAGQATHLRLWRIVPGQPLRAEIAVYDVRVPPTRPLAYATAVWR
jgi:hypothetical protein